MDFCRIRCSRSSRDSVAGADTAERFMTSVASPRELNAAQQAAPDVAVGDDADEAVWLVQHQRNLDAAALDRGNGFATVACVPTMALRQDFMVTLPHNGRYRGVPWTNPVYRGCRGGVNPNQALRGACKPIFA